MHRLHLQVRASYQSPSLLVLCRDRFLFTACYINETYYDRECMFELLTSVKSSEEAVVQYMSR